MLSDGQNTTGAKPLEVAQLAASLGVKVFTVGFGSKEGVTIEFGGWSMRVRLDEDTLKTIANLTHGQYLHARSGARSVQRLQRALPNRRPVPTTTCTSPPRPLKPGSFELTSRLIEQDFP